MTVCRIAKADPQTTGLFFNNPGASDNYTLFAPNLSTSTYLIDRNGNVVNEWESDYTPGLHGYLLEDGSLIRAAQPHGAGGNGSINALGAGGLIERFDWDGNKVWEYAYDSPTFLQHHDIEVIPNGNLLMIAWEFMSESDATDAGRDPNLPGEGYLYPDHIVEVQPDLNAGVGGNIVWEWHATDHLVQDLDSSKNNWHGSTGVKDHPELININYVSSFQTGGGQAEDWMHSNGIDYNPALDQIVLSVREFSEFWVIDHSTTIDEAESGEGGNSGKGGDLLYRWGNPQTYGAGDDSDRMLYFQHDAKWIPEGLPGEGNITLFNNGFGRPGTEVSSVLEIDTPVDEMGNYSMTPGEPYDPNTPEWSYDAPVEDFSPIISGAQRLANGNTLITYGGLGTFVEVTPEGEEVWKYVSPHTNTGMLGPTDPIPTIAFPAPLPAPLHANLVFRATDYSPDYFVEGLIPEPSTLTLALFGVITVLGFAGYRRRRL